MFVGLSGERQITDQFLYLIFRSADKSERNRIAARQYGQCRLVHHAASYIFFEIAAYQILASNGKLIRLLIDVETLRFGDFGKRPEILRGIFQPGIGRGRLGRDQNRRIHIFAARLRRPRERRQEHATAAG